MNANQLYQVFVNYFVNLHTHCRLHSAALRTVNCKSQFEEWIYLTLVRKIRCIFFCSFHVSMLISVFAHRYLLCNHSFVDCKEGVRSASLGNLSGAARGGVHQTWERFLVGSCRRVTKWAAEGVIRALLHRGILGGCLLPFY